MSKHKFIKPLLIGVSCAIPVGLVVGLSVNWTHMQYISAVGSSGVKPFIENFGKQYHNAFKNYDVTVESGGSTFAVEQLAKGFAQVGNASNNPFYTVRDTGYQEQWKNKKTFTLGWEGLVLMYKMPDGLSQDARDNFELLIRKENIKHLYAVFSGFFELKNGLWENGYECMWHYMSDKAQKACNETDREICRTTPIIPYVRSGGNTAANTSIAFSYYSNLCQFTDLTENQQKAFSGGQYGHDCQFIETDESNARAWQSFVANDDPGSIVYLTSGFMANENNVKEMVDRGYRLAGYLPADQEDESKAVFFNTIEDLDKICCTGGYNWYRPINAMIDLNNQASKDFIYWIYFNTNEDFNLTEKTDWDVSQNYIDTVKKCGAKPLDKNHFTTMADSNKTTMKDAIFDLSVSDLTLNRASIFFETYGAGELWKWRG